MEELYPPLVDSKMPSFLKDDVCRIYFAINPANSIGDINSVHLILEKPNGESALNTIDYYPNEIKISSLKEDLNIIGDYKYYVEIYPNQIISNIKIPVDLREVTEFETGVIYSAKLRLSSKEPDNLEVDISGNILYPDPGSNWYFDNQLFFSPWSSTCLIKAIPEPLITFQGVEDAFETKAVVYDNYQLTAQDFDNYDINFVEEGIQPLKVSDYDSGILSEQIVSNYVGNYFGYGSLAIFGKYYNEDITEPLYSYRLKIYEASGNVSGAMILDSGIIYPDPIVQYGNKYELYGNKKLGAETQGAFNDFRYGFSYGLQDDQKYLLEIEILTKNGYQNSYYFYFVTAYSEIAMPGVTYEIVPEYENGRIKIDLEIVQPLPLDSNLIIRRSSHKSNFKIWEPIFEYNFSINPLVSGFTFYDNSLENGYLYKYYIAGNENLEPILMLHEDIFLIGEKDILKLKFNPNISSFSHVIKESKTETLGSQYPFIRRNANLNYKEFMIEGLISFEENEIFAMDEDLFGQDWIENFNNYNIYESAQLIDNYNTYNYIKEKEFRNKVMEFLYDGKPKLYKSLTEGNIIIKLLEISLTPLNELGRLLYSFSATATEIDECSIINLQKYNINFFKAISKEFGEYESPINELPGWLGV